MTQQKQHINDPELLDQQVKKFQKELNSGTVALVLLSIIDKAEEPLYGYEIAKQLQQDNEGKTGAIYPVLRNLHGKGLIDCDVRMSESGPPRKYFSISPLGKAVLTQWLAIWRSTQQQVNNILGTRGDND